MPVPAIILAAGASRRLGQPKQLVRIGDETLLGRSIRVACEAAAEAVFVVLGANSESITAAVDLSRTHIVINANWEQGIASSIQAGVSRMIAESPAAAGTMVMVCDQPELTAQHLAALLQAYERTDGGTIVASKYAGIAGIPAIFPRQEFAGLMALQGDYGARHLLRESARCRIEIEFEGGEVDVDYPSDLNRMKGSRPIHSAPRRQRA